MNLVMTAEKAFHLNKLTVETWLFYHSHTFLMHLPIALLKSTVGIARRAFTARVCKTALTVLTVES